MSLGHHLVALPSSNETSDKLGSFKIPFEPFSTYVTLTTTSIQAHKPHLHMQSGTLLEI